MQQAAVAVLREPEEDEDALPAVAQAGLWLQAPSRASQVNLAAMSKQRVP